MVAELRSNGEHQDDLRHEGQQTDADVLLVHGEIQHVEVRGEVVPDVLPSDVVEVGLVQKFAAEAAVEKHREGAQRDGRADGEPDPRPVDLEEAPPAAEVGERQVEAEGVDDGVDLEVDGQAEEEAGEHKDPGPEEVQGDQDEGADDGLRAAPRAHADHQRVVEPRHRRHPRAHLPSPSEGEPQRVLDERVDQLSGDDVEGGEEELTEEGRQRDVGNEEEGQDGGVPVGAPRVGTAALVQVPRGVRDHSVVDVGVLDEVVPVVVFAVEDEHEAQEEGDDEVGAERHQRRQRLRRRRRGGHGLLGRLP